LGSAALEVAKEVMNAFHFERAFRSLMKSQWLKPMEIEKQSLKKMRALLTHCYATVPYYNKIFKERNLKPQDIKSVSDLQKLPILTKSIARENFDLLIASCFNQNRLSISFTAGSTGEPFRFVNDSCQLTWVNAAVLRSFYWAGYRRFDKMVNFWGFQSEHDLFPTKPWQRQMVVSSLGADEKKIKKVLRFMGWFKPKGIRGYSTSLYLLAKYNDDVKLKFAVSTAEMLFKHYRKLIEEKFGCEVYDNYSSREFMMASECEEHQGYHIVSENCILEFIRDNEQVSPGETGRILVTDLVRYGMPFVRYDVGDMGKSSPQPCSCGRGLPLIESIEGRVTDMIFTPSGKFISPSVMFPLGWMGLDIKQFQVIQKSKEDLMIKIVKGPTYSDKDTQFILNSLQKRLQDMKIEIKFVDEIASTKSGKRLLVFSEIAPSEKETEI
jgi:phenylacetate-CoA ligase